MSSMMGPVEGAFGSRPLRTTLPMEVVMVSRYIAPVASSWMTWLELMLKIPRDVTSPMVPTGASWLTSASSGISKQAMTPAKPQGGEGGCTSANALVEGGGAGSEGVLGKQIGDLTGVIWENGWDLPLGLDSLVGGGVSPAATTGQDGCSTLFQSTNFGVLSSDVNSVAGGSVGTLVGEEVVDFFPSSSSGAATP